MRMFSFFVFAAVLAPCCEADRPISIKGQQFWDTKANRSVLFAGPNIVMKGHPWLPDVNGTTSCMNITVFPNDTCKTFSEHDIDFMKAKGYTAIRLGVTWAGAQPTNMPQIDAEFLEKLYAILDLCEKNGIHVILDPHQDAYGTSTCGQGAPMWFSKLGVASDIGKPLVPLRLPYAPKGSIKNYTDGACSHTDDTTWGLFAGDPDYNIKNPCCLLNNGGNSNIILSEEAQKGFTYLFNGGRSYYVRYIKLLAEAVKDKPSAVAIELFNEPTAFGPQDALYGIWHTWKECYDAIQDVAPGMLVGVMSIGEQPIDPILNRLTMPLGYTDWLLHARYAFYAWHWYHGPPHKQGSISNAKSYQNDWNMPSLLTEHADEEVGQMALAAGIGQLYWSYSGYCNTAPDQRCHNLTQEQAACRNDGAVAHCQHVPGCDFGACITGYGRKLNPPLIEDAIISAFGLSPTTMVI